MDPCPQPSCSRNSTRMEVVKIEVVDVSESSPDDATLQNDEFIQFEPGQEVKMEVEAADNDNNGDVAGLSEALSFQVFGNDMLIEMILEKVIYPKEVLSRRDICSVRGVSKRWLSAVSDLLRKRRDPLFMLTLNKENSRSDQTYCRANGKLLAQFVEMVSGESSLEENNNIPTFSLKLEAEFFRRENHKDLSNCLIKCGGGLVGLDLTFPLNTTMTMLFHSFELPKLQRLTVQFSSEELESLAPLGGPDRSVGMMNNSSLVFPLQTILNVTKELRELILRQPIACHHHTFTPMGFEYLKLPQTITALMLDCPLKNSDLTLLLENELPNLVSLRLFGSARPYHKDTIYEVLNKYRTHLKTLNLRGVQFFGPHAHAARFLYGPLSGPTELVFPVMECLETLIISSHSWQLGGEEDSKWEQQLPVLNELRLLHQTDPVLRKWANAHASSSSLRRLFVSLVTSTQTLMAQHPYVHPAPGDQLAPLTLENMQGINLTMPFLTCLEITVCGEQTCALKYLFMEMRSLQKLAISVKGSPEGIHLVHWDALLVGVPADFAVSLRRNPSFWDHVQLKDDYPSIRKLTELRSLALVENFSNNALIRTEPDRDRPIISDLVFHYAFLQMPALKYLLMSGRFRVSPQMAEKWQQEKGSAIHTIRRA